MLIFKGAKLTDGSVQDLAIQEGRIYEVGEHLQHDGSNEIDLHGEVYVSRGWIDLHTHAFSKFPPYCAYGDEIGYQTGVTTVVDAGSSGYEDIDEFYEESKECKTRVLAFLNVSKTGLGRVDELSDLNHLSFPGLKRACEKYPHFIIGLKARISSSVVGKQGIQPLKIAKRYADELHLPLMVHIGNGPPMLGDILAELRAGDIVTHCFHGKDNHLFRNGLFPGLHAPIQPCREALSRGVLFDIGHGTDSFSFAVARKAKAEGVPFHTISTDLYKRNQEKGPVYDMATTLTKFLYLGYDLETVIDAVTDAPANLLYKGQSGRLKKGMVADLTLFTVDEGEHVLTDSLGESVTYHQKISPKGVVLRGEYIEL
ncbi:dihydroorotase [Kroppenstedtia sanguinis]|uniref:Amidohydrolase/deacetylase family metallohydrolase n=1 Tax=Kroppenstedtia sanguinis TaxID=1380684 RepID=A0ABW4CBV6_9BACL